MADEDATFTDWLALLGAQRMSVPSTILSGGIAFLERACEPGRGWGRIPGLEPELHASALAVAALAATSESTRWELRNVAMSFTRDVPHPQLAQLGLPRLTDLLLLIGAGDGPDHEAAATVVDAVHARIAQTQQQDLSTGALGALLATIHRYFPASRTRFSSGLVQLLDRQADDGAWTAGRGGGASTLATALAMRAVHGTGDDRARDACRRASSWLQQTVAAGSWNGVSTTRDIASNAIVLRAIAEDDQCDVELLGAGVEWLADAVNEDGGWGSVLDTPSTVDASALAVSALIACGQLEQIPARLAFAAVNDLEHRVRHKAQELAGMHERIDSEVHNRASELLRKLTKLEQRERESTEKLKAARSDAEALQRANDRLARYLRTQGLSRTTPLSVLRSDSLRSATVGAVTVIAALAAVPAVVSDGAPVRWALVGGAATIVVAAALSLFLLLRRRREWAAQSLSVDGPQHRAALDGYGEPIAWLRRTFLLMSDSWPIELREHVLSFIIAEMVDLPPSEIRGYALRRSGRLGMSDAMQRDFVEWAEAYADLGRTARRILHDELRRDFVVRLS